MATSALDAFDGAQLRALLSNAMSHDANVRSTAEVGLKRAGKSPKIIPMLLACGASDGDEGVRHLAYVVLKRRASAAFAKLSPNDKASTQSALLDAVMKESRLNTRNAIVDVIAKIARLTVPLGQWKELLEFMGQCASSPEPAHRELAFGMFASLTETIVGALSHHFGALGQLFAQGLVDESTNVRMRALKAVGALVSNSTGEPEQVAIMKSLVPHIIEAAKTALQAGDEDGAGIVFEVLDELTESQTSALSGHVPAVVSFCIEVAVAEQLSTLARRRALDVVAFMARHKPKALTKSKLIEPLLVALCPLCGEPKEEELAGEDDVDADEEEELQVQTVASQLIDVLALKVPAKHILPTVISFASTNLNSSSERLRHAAVAVLGVVTEGCCEGVRAHAAQIIPNVVPRLADEHAAVRGAAAFTLGQFAEHLNLTIDAACRDLHKQVLPTLFFTLPNERVKSVQERMMYAMDAWLEDLQGEVEEYVKPLLDIVFLAIDSDAKPHVREMLLSALASATASCGRKVHEFFRDLLPRLTKCFNLTSDAELSVRARALEVLGMLISSDREHTFIDAQTNDFAVRVALSGFELDFAELREYAHGLFGEVSEAMGEGFEQYLDVCVGKAIESIELDDGIMFDSEDEADRDELDSDDDYEGDGGQKTSGYSIRSGVMDEKASACKALNCYASHCPRAFAKYIPKVSKLLVSMSDYMHEMVRVQAHLALGQTAIAALMIDPTSSQSLAHESLSATIRCVLDDDDKEAVSASIESAALVLKVLKDHPTIDVNQHIVDLTAASLEILEGRAVCQMEDDYDSEAGDDDDDDDEEDPEAGLSVIEAIADLLPALASYMGASFAQHFTPHFNALMRRTSENRTETERLLCYATLVEVVRAVGPPAAMCAPVALPGCLRDLTSGDVGLRRNCAYCAGVLVSVGGEHAAQFHSVVAQALVPMLSAENEPDGGVRDNAVGALARLLQVVGIHGEGAALLDVVLRALPLRNDLEEGPDVYHWLANTIADTPTALSEAHVRQVMLIFNQVFAEKLAAEVTLRIITLSVEKGCGVDPRVAEAATSLQQHHAL